MKPQKKAITAKKATKPSVVVKKRRMLIEKSTMDAKKEKKVKKFEKVEEIKKKLENEKKKLEEKKLLDDKKKPEERRKDKIEKPDEKKKQIKEPEKKTEKIIEKKAEEKNEEEVLETGEKKKGQKLDGKLQIEKTLSDPKKKLDKVEERTKIKTDDELQEKINVNEEMDSIDNKTPSSLAVTKKKIEKKKELKLPKPESKENSKSIKELLKEKKIERKKTTDIDSSGKLSPSRKKDPKVKLPKKTGPKKTVLSKKGSPSVAKRFLEKKLKLVKCLEGDNSLTEDNSEAVKKIKKKTVVSKNKSVAEKKANLEKQKLARLPPKKLILRKEEKARNLEKAKKKESKDLEKDSEVKKSGSEEVVLDINTSEIKKEVIDEKEFEKAKEVKEEPKKVSKNVSKAKLSKKNNKKLSKVSKDQNEDSNREESEEEESKQDGSKTSANSKENAENLIKINLKVEAINGETSESSSTSESSDDDSWRNGKARSSKRKDRTRSPSDERARRMRLFGFWSGPKRHRVASLNALAKVHCLYENEAGGVYLGGFCKPKPEKEKLKEKKAKEEKDKEKEKEKEREKEAVIKKEKDKKEKIKNEQETAPKRKLRNVPGLRGKHWDMHESVSSSSSSSEEEECETEKNEKVKKTYIKRKKKTEEVMDLKDMVVCKRMASLNASAILAASYSDEKIRLGSDSDSSSESEVEIIRRKRNTETDAEKQKRLGSESEEVIKPSKKVVIVNQDTDVTITGVYVNQTRSTHHEGFCSIAGMQYRISSTSHTQTAATAVATELHDQQKPEQPCKSYTPLGALSSMQPPGAQGNCSNMSPRRHSAFSAPHQHGYYQPAGPLIQHPPTLPPVKGPPPEPTPTPPQNSEGSDDLVATSASSGTSGGPGFYRAYCPQYYGTPPQYQDLCYPPTYAHPHPHPPPYYKYPPRYRTQYYGYQESGGGGGPGGGGAGAGPGVVEYQPPPPPGEYPLPPYYAGYPPPPPPLPPNPAYLHAQGRPFVEHAAFQSCPCPMQSCPKNVDTGPLIGNGKGAPVASGPGLSLPPSALVGPPSPARGLAGLAPPHGANAWDTDRVQLNPLRNLNQNQPSLPTSHNHVGSHNRPQNSECRTKDDTSCTDKKMRKCTCQKHACTSTCEVKIESISPVANLSTTSCPSSKIHNFKLENNNVKCESCSVEIGENLTCVANCNVKCESGYKCEILKCEQCDKEGEMAILDMDKDSGILIDDKLETDTEVKEELNDVVVIDGGNWKKADYEPTVRETVVEEKEPSERILSVEEEPKCQKLTKRKLSLDSLSDSRKKRKVSKRTLSVGSTRDLVVSEQSSTTSPQTEILVSEVDSASESCTLKKKQAKKETQNPKRKAESSNPSETAAKKSKSSKSTNVGAVSNSLKPIASDTSIMETINNVIQKSVQMTEKKDKKAKNVDRVAEKNKKNANLMSTIKKVTRKLELSSVAEKICPPKTEVKINQPKGKVEVKPKPKIQDAKCKSKVKAKLIEVKSKILDTKSKVQEPKTRESCKKIEYLPKLRSGEVIEDVKKSVLAKKKRKSTKKTLTKKISGNFEDNVIVNEHLTVARKPFLKPKWSNGWSWEGDAYEAKVYLTNEESAIRRCYASMRHVSGDILRPRDCVLLRSGPRKADLPFVAKIAALWENPDDGEMMFSLLWYYRPEHTEQGRTEFDTEDEVFASRHRDANSVACIEDKCYILTFNEYCRYRKNIRRLEEGLDAPCLIVPPGDQVYPRENRQPPLPVPADMVLFCRRVYDYRGKKLVKNPG